VVNPQEVGGNTKTHKLQALIMQEWASISQDVAQKLIYSMPGQISEVLKKKGQHWKYWKYVIINKSH
jgi:hypothetical protein